MQVEIDFKDQQTNDLYDFQKQQVLDEIKYKITSYLQKNPEQTRVFGLEKYIFQYLNYQFKNNDLKFTFGKYKDVYVDLVLRKDKEYCKWFSENVIGKDFNTLKILDYIHKRLSGCDYFFVTFDEAWTLLKTILTPNLRDNIDQDKRGIKKDYEYFHKNDDPFDFDVSYFQKKETKKYGPYKSCKTNYDDFDVGYEDECSEFCYYGDCLLDYGDLC